MVSGVLASDPTLQIFVGFIYGVQVSADFFFLEGIWVAAGGSRWGQEALSIMAAIWGQFCLYSMGVKETYYSKNH